MRKSTGMEASQRAAAGRLVAIDWLRGVALLVIWLVMMLSVGRLRVAAALLMLLAGGVLAVEPITETITSGGPIQHLLNNHSGSEFPLVPFSSLLFFGAGLGVLASMPEAGRRRLYLLWGATFVIGVALAESEPALERLYGAYPVFWIITIGQRLWRIAVIGVALSILGDAGQRWPRILTSLPARVVGFYSRSSLSAFVVHICLLYGVRLGRWGSWLDIQPTSFLHGRCTWPAYWAMVLAMIAATGLICWLLQAIGRGEPWKLRVGAHRPEEMKEPRFSAEDAGEAVPQLSSNAQDGDRTILDSTGE